MMENDARGLLMERLDACLQERAKEYMEPRDKNGLPYIENIYYLQGCYCCLRPILHKQKVPYDLMLQ